MEAPDIATILQAGGTPVIGVVGYFLWQLNRQMRDLQVSIDTLIDTLIRFVPGIKEHK